MMTLNACCERNMMDVLCILTRRRIRGRIQHLLAEDVLISWRELKQGLNSVGARRLGLGWAQRKTYYIQLYSP